MGLPFALKIRDVTPISEAISVKKLPLSNIANESIMARQEQIHKISSDLVKYDVIFFKFINLQKKKHPLSHLQRPNDVRRMLCLLI